MFGKIKPKTVRRRQINDNELLSFIVEKKVVKYIVESKKKIKSPVYCTTSKMNIIN